MITSGRDFNTAYIHLDEVRTAVVGLYVADRVSARPEKP